MNIFFESTNNTFSTSKFFYENNLYNYVSGTSHFLFFLSNLVKFSTTLFDSFTHLIFPSYSEVLLTTELRGSSWIWPKINIFKKRLVKMTFKKVLNFKHKIVWTLPWGLKRVVLWSLQKWSIPPTFHIKTV